MCVKKITCLFFNAFTAGGAGNDDVAPLILEENFRMNERLAGTTVGGAESSECIILVCLEMGLSFFGIVANLLIVTTLRQEETLKGSTINYLLFNLCFSNLVISFLVKPISAIYVGYAVSTGEAQVRKKSTIE